MSTSTAHLHAATGGANHAPDQPYVVLMHGAGSNRTVWAIQARHLAARGHNVVALDLPGHGLSAGPAPTSVEGYAEAVLAALDARGVAHFAAVGHSMGAMIALQLAGTQPDRVTHLGMVGAGLQLAVNPALLEATEQDPLIAVDAIVDWGFSGESHLGMSQSPGSWIEGGTRAMMRVEVARHPGSLHADFTASGSFDGAVAASGVRCPAAVVSGSRDIMTSPKLGRAVAAAISGSAVTELVGSGHMLMSERPAEVTRALVHLLR